MAEVKILVADDDQGVLDLLAETLSAEGYEVFSASNGEQAVEIAQNTAIDVAILDLRMPIMDGLEGLKEIKAIDQNIQVLIMTGYGEVESLDQILSNGACDYILKPFEVEEFTRTIQDILMRGELVLENNQTEKELKARISQLEAHFDKRTRQLRESQIKYKQIVDNSGDGIVVTQGEMTKFVNPKTLELVGYTEEEITRIPWIDLIHPDDRVMLDKRSLRSLEGKESPITCSFRALKKNGETVWIEINAVRGTWEGRPATTSFLRDITERKRAEEALRESEKRLKTLLDSVQAGILLVNPETHTIVDANPVAISMIGASREEVVDALCHRYLCFEEKDRCPILNSGMNFHNAEQVLQTADGGQIPILRSAVSVTLDGRRHLLETFQDISELKEAQTQLTLAKESAETYSQELTEALEVSESLREEIEEAKKHVDAANRAKDEFLASMSHELRSPMAPIIGMADLLWETPLNFEQRRFVEAIKSSGESLLLLINDLLDLSKVEARQIVLEKIPFNLMEVVKNTCEVQAFHVYKKDLDLVWWVRPEVQTRLLGDPVRLGQVLTNLIGNAVKFTKKGEVYVEVRRPEDPEASRKKEVDSRPKQDQSGTVELLFSVVDTGIGIPLEKQEVIFDRFIQADASITRRYGGTGLGLAISSRLTECMGGRMWLESEVGQGSAFYFTARFEVLPGVVSLDTPEADVRGVKVLIIDDSANNRKVLSEMLSRWGAEAMMMEDGERGLAEMRRASDSGDPYGLVLLDYRMPGLDGFQVAERIIEDSTIYAPVIMMLTPKARKAGMKTSKAMGITHYLLKPIRWSDLKDVVMAALGREEAAVQKRPPDAGPIAPEAARPLHILLVDDSEKIRELIRAFLKNTPYTLDTAENGEIAVEKFTTARYDLVLMDIEMPVMDGHTATREIRRWEAQTQAVATPIIALTAHALVEHTRKSEEAGCTAHLTKPIKKADLLAAIRKYAAKGESKVT